MSLDITALCTRVEPRFKKRFQLSSTTAYASYAPRQLFKRVINYRELRSGNRVRRTWDPRFFTFIGR